MGVRFVRQSYKYGTGIDPLDPTEATTPMGFTRFAAAKLGCETAIGGSRAGWYAQLNREMEAQGWSWEDMITTVEYLSWREVRLHKIFGIFFYVAEAKRWKQDMEVHDLQAKVAEAMSLEQDSSWLRRLSLARGRALERVYREWVKENEIRGRTDRWNDAEHSAV